MVQEQLQATTMHADARPIPDPTVLTTEASIRLERAIRELIRSEIVHLTELVTEKLNVLDVRFDEKLALIDIRFNMLDARTAEQKQDTTNALNAALAAQKEAVAAQTASSEKSITKSETATTERIKGVETLLSTSTKATDDKITDLKDRVIAIEAIKLGATEGVNSVRNNGLDNRALIATVVSIVMVLIAASSILIAVFK